MVSLEPVVSCAAIVQDTGQVGCVVAITCQT